MKSGGSIESAHGGQADFSMDVKSQKSKKTTKIVGNFSYNDAAFGVSIHASKISSLSFNGNQAHFTGTARLIKRSQISFTVDVTDNGTPGTFDIFSIDLSNGYSASGTLTSGDIQIH